jgi:hypothetical protein
MTDGWQREHLLGGGGSGNTRAVAGKRMMRANVTEGARRLDNDKRPGVGHSPASAPVRKMAPPSNNRSVRMARRETKGKP